MLRDGVPRAGIRDLDNNVVVRFELKHIVAFCAGDRPSDRVTQWTLSEPSGTRPIKVTLELDRSAIWLCDAYELEKHEDLDAVRCRIRLTVPGIADLRTLLLGLGPQGRLVAPNELRGLQRELADSILAMYA
jgi:predicted DNA-binding transcriptional regulator YafY